MEAFFTQYEHTIQFFSALGTCGAVIVSLGYAIYEYRSRKKDKQEAKIKENGLELVDVGTIINSKYQDRISVTTGFIFHNHIPHTVTIKAISLDFYFPEDSGLEHFSLWIDGGVKEVPAYGRFIAVDLGSKTMKYEYGQKLVSSLQSSKASLWLDTSIGRLIFKVNSEAVKKLQQGWTKRKPHPQIP